MAETKSILSSYPDYEATIGMEVHVQLTTNTKIFCACANVVSKEPNVNICEVCAGYPGSLPVLNKKVVDYAILAGLATHSTIATHSKFDRKHYFYPDLPKNYQITQQYAPICVGGYIPIRLEDGSIKKIGLDRIHIEEDAGKNIHGAHNESFVDLNRAGTPLLEVVSKPDLSNAYEVKAYLKALRAIVQYLQICTGNMQEGAFRADTNISVRKKGATTLGTKRELKNINSFKFIGDAIEYELGAQIELLESGQKVRQETRLWNVNAKVTELMRTKEEAADYRFFPDPDLCPVVVDAQWIERLRATMPELPFEKFDRFCNELGLTPYEADILIEDYELAHYFEAALRHTTSTQLINWVLRDVMGYLKEQKIEIADFKVTPEKLAEIINMVESGKINNSAAKKVFEIIAIEGGSPVNVVRAQGLEQIGSTDELEAIVKKVLADNADQVALYKQGGNERMFGFFVGQVMGQTKGKGNPKVITELLKKYIN
jgi:aspartyl-tRNA(Asn)/glutamyl-tRNA(Gln) amidotransferase subunit B